MQVQFADRLTIDRSHRTKDGYLRVTAKGARSGIQEYLGREVDPEGKHFTTDQVVKVYRPPEEVFDAKAVASFVGKPITDDHPREAVTARNWRDHTRGVIGGAVRDGEWLRFDVALMDADLIEKVEAGKRELSGGYGCDLAIESGTTPDGQTYDAVQRGIVGNHLAVVDRARAGSEARICDGGNTLFQVCDAATVILNVTDDGEPRMSKKIMLDGLQVDLADAAAVEVAITKLQGKLSDAEKQVDKLTTDLAAANTAVQTKDGEIAALKQQLADAQDPAKLQAAADARAKLVADAKRVLPNLVTDGKSAIDIKRAVVTAKLGDAAKEMADASVEGAFLALVPAADAKPDPLRTAISDQVAGPGMVNLTSLRDAARVASLN